jgi:hypothetical protein
MATGGDLEELGIPTPIERLRGTLVQDINAPFDAGLEEEDHAGDEDK